MELKPLVDGRSERILVTGPGYEIVVTLRLYSKDNAHSTVLFENLSDRDLRVTWHDYEDDSNGYGSM